MLFKRRAFHRAAREEAARIRPEIENSKARMELMVTELEQALATMPGGRVECPHCGSLMVVRTARRGNNAGGKFWGCPHWPNCTGIRSYPAKTTRS